MCSWTLQDTASKSDLSDNGLNRLMTVEDFGKSGDRESGEPEEYVQVRENDIMYGIFLGQDSKRRREQGRVRGSLQRKLRKKKQSDSESDFGTRNEAGVRGPTCR